MAANCPDEPRVTEFIHREFASEWTKIEFKHTDGFRDREAIHWSMIPNWRFSPGGSSAVAVDETVNGEGFNLFFYDVPNKLWFGHSFFLKDIDIKYNDIFTYHMLNENTVVIIKMTAYNQVKQYVFNVDMEKYTAKINETIIHDFMPRLDEVDRPNWTRFRHYSPPDQHVPVILKKQYYTALVGRKQFGEDRKIIYLVPLNPLDSKIQPMEFSVPTKLSTTNKQQFDDVLAGLKYNRSTERSNFVFCGTTCSSHILQFVPVIQFNDLLEGAFITIDLSMLINIYDKPIKAIEQRTRDIEQADAIKLINSPSVKIGWIKMEHYSGLDGTVVTYEQGGLADRHNQFTWNAQQEAREIRLKFADKIVETKTTVFSWFSLHPCGAVLQFYMSLDRDGKIYVRVVSMYRNTLKALASTKLLFNDPDGQKRIDSIDRLNRMVFNGEAPIKLDKET